MISIKKLGGSGAAASYYEKADYYTKDGESNDISSSWQGGLAKEFGLDGPVDHEEFKKLLEGKLPNGDELGASRNGKKEHTSGWDLTFSAPKSVSILALVGDDKNILKAHSDAVSGALSHVEKEFLKGRMNNSFHKGSIDLDKGLIAKFTHTTSRKLDPQLHTHSVVLNAGMAKDGDIRSVDSRKIYESSMLVGQIYRNELASQLKKLGYTIDWDSKTGLFEVAGVGKDLIENFSKRRVEIKDIANELGIEGAKGMDAVTVSSRDKKQEIGREALIDSWDEQAKGLGVNVKSLNEDTKKMGEYHDRPSWGTYIKDKFNPGTSITETVKDAVSQLSHYESAFSKTDIQLQALKFSGDKYSYTDISKALNGMVKDGVVIESKTVKGMVTTPEVVRQEKYILKVEKDNRDRFKPLMGDREIDRKIEELSRKGVDFTEGQKESFIHLLKTEDMVSGVQGHAGVGKSFMLKPLVDVAKSKGLDVKVAAPFGEIANSLGKELGVESNTLKSMLLKLEREIGQKKGGINSSTDSNSILIIDEASTINSPDMASLMTAASTLGHRVILSGDRAQLGGVERGRAFAQMIDNGMGTTVNKDIVRQKEGTEARDVVESTYARNFNNALNRLGDKVLENENKGERLDKFVGDYVRFKSENEKHLGLIMDNKTRKEATNLIRDTYKKNGKISKEELKVETLINAKNDAVSKRMAQSYKEGMKVRFLQSYKKIGVKKDDYFSVVSSNSREVTLSDGKREFKWNPKKIAGNKEIGGVASYVTESIGVAKGDEIRFKDTNNELDVKNGRQGKVLNIEGGKITVEGEDGKIRVIDPKNERHKHFEHSYISTAYTAQGLTGDSVQVMADSYQKNLLNDSSFLVGVSRAKSNIHLYVDSKEKVSEALDKRSGLKKSGLEHIEKDRLHKDNESRNITQTFASDPKGQSLQKDQDQGKAMPPQNQREKVFLP